VATYLYGIVHRPARPRPWGAGIGAPPQRLRVVAFGRIAALVSGPGTREHESEGRALRRDLRAHEEAVRRAMELGTILPVSFGTIFEDDRQVVDELLDPNGDELAALLDEFEGLVELTVKAELVQDEALRRLLERDAELRAWRDAASFAGTDEQIAFGQAIAECVEEEARRRAERLLPRLASLAQDVRVTAEARGLTIVKASFLVDGRRIRQFDAAVEELASESAPLVQFDYVGPLPPYSFVSLNLRAPAA
jgi:Gas vesicle synthesis protein GvpL/GvpF